MKKILDKFKNFLSNDTFIDILFLICIILLIIFVSSHIISINANAANEPSDGGGSARITDLTGYTVTVPSGWSASAGYGSFSTLSYYYPAGYGEESQYIGLFVGYEFDPIDDYIPKINSILCIPFLDDISPASSFTITIIGGDDALNPALIQWFYDNNATFVNNNAPPVETGTFTVYDSFTELTQTYTFEIGQTIGDWLNSEYNTVGAEVVTGQILTMEDDVSFISFVTIESNQCYSTYKVLNTGPNDWVYPSYELIDGKRFVLEKGELVSYCYKQGWLDSFDTWYNSGYNSGYNTGYNEGYSEGESDGYYNGLSMGESSALGQNLLGDILSAPIRALDGLVIIDTPSGFTISVWNIFSALIGIALFIWFLKMFAGG